MLTRTERFAALTIPKIMLPEGMDVMNTDITHDYQFLGAQAVNHLTNKIAMTLFAPTRPFFKAQLSEKAQEENGDTDPVVVDAAMANIEREAMRRMDRLAIRPKIYSAIRNLIVTGNVLVEFLRDSLRVYGMRQWAVKRTYDGGLHTLIIREKMKFDELADKVQGILHRHYQDDSEVHFYRLIERVQKGRYKLTCAVDTHILPPAFSHTYSEETLPFQVMTWDLGDNDDYATGLVEEYVGGFEAISQMAEGMVNGGTMAAEFRWLLSPGLTKADDFEDTENGSAIPGNKDDISVVGPENHEAISVLSTIYDKYARGIGAAFLLHSAVTRDAERVTAEEIRLSANELESAHGGTYSTLATNMQGPVARWLLTGVDKRLNSRDVEVSVVTGLDGMSRNGDLENLRLAFQDLTFIATAPDEVKARLKYNPLVKYIGAGRGVDLSPFVMSDEEFQAEQDRLMQQQMQMQAQQSAADVAGQAAGASAAGIQPQ